MAEFPDLGHHCQICHNLDFLPIECHFCNGIFCKDHLSLITHNCPQKDVQPASTQSNQPFIPILQKCCFCHINVPDIELVVCDKCNTKNCLTHRHPGSHKCVQDEQPSESKVTVKPIITSTAPRVKGTKNDSLARKVAMMKLKQTAKGMAGIPQTERLHFNVTHQRNNQVESESTIKQTKQFYLSKEWSIGKCVDWLAPQFGLTNNNNNPNAAKLSLYPNNQSQPFSFSSKLSELLNDNQLNDGDELILKLNII